MTQASKTHARTYKQACKDAYKQRKPMGAQASKASISSHGAEKGYAQSKLASRRCISQVVTPKQSHTGVGCNHTRSSTQRALSMAKPRTREANMDFKHRSKQAYTYIQGNDPNPLMQAQVCGYRPRPHDLDLQPTNMGQNSRKRDIKDKRATIEQGIATKHADPNIGKTQGLKRHRPKHRHYKEHIKAQT